MKCRSIDSLSDRVWQRNRHQNTSYMAFSAWTGVKPKVSIARTKHGTTYYFL